MAPHRMTPSSKRPARPMPILMVLSPLLSEAHDYYQQQDYKDDKLAKGKALHPKMLVAWKDFAASDVRLRDVVETLNDRAQAADLVRVEKEEGRAKDYIALR